MAYTTSMQVKDLVTVLEVNQSHPRLDFYTVDIVLHGVEAWDPDSALEAGLTTTVSLTDHLRKLAHGSGQYGAVKVLLPSRDGYVSRSDMVRFRLHGLDVICKSSLEPRQHVQAVGSESVSDDLDSILDRAIGFVALKNNFDSQESVKQALDHLEVDIKERVAIRWILPDPIPYKRVALVGGLEEPRSLATVKAMGIGLVILDQPGNMFEADDGRFGHLREEFIPFNMSPDGGAPERIVEALKGREIHGVHTRYDIHHTNVAKACRLLGLPTSDPQSYAIATDKFDARALEPDHDTAFRVKDVDHLKHLLPTLNLTYPLIVKPTTGRNSWGVLRCDDEQQLVEAAAMAHGRLIGMTEDGKEIHSEVMVEPYIDGPEFDVDLVLWNGELLFHEVSDNFPCAGDIPADAPKDFSHQEQTHRDFQETLFVYPSVLCEAEQRILVNALHESVLRLGFKHGVFHVEARMRDSTMAYAIRDGRVDLRERQDFRKEQTPSSFLIETNPRPPGYLSLLRAGWMYGVDYWALHVLRCVNDEKRYLAFSVPRVRPSEHVCALNFIMPENGGILKSGDPGPDIARRRPDLMDSIPLYYNEFKAGQFVPPPVSTNFLFMTRMTVESHKGREHLLDTIRDIRKEWTFDIADGDNSR